MIKSNGVLNLTTLMYRAKIHLDDTKQTKGVRDKVICNTNETGVRFIDSRAKSQNWKK